MCVSDMPLHRQDGKIALDIAKKRNNSDVVRFLQEPALDAAKAKGLFKQHIEERSGVSAVPGPRAVWARFNRQ